VKTRSRWAAFSGCENGSYRLGSSNVTYLTAKFVLEIQVACSVKKVFHVLRVPSVQYRLHISPSLLPDLKQVNLVDHDTLYSFKVLFRIAFPSTFMPHKLFLVLFKIFRICHYLYYKCRPIAVFWFRTVHPSRCLPPFGMNVIFCLRLQNKIEARRMIFSLTLVTIWHRP
jgi:hypothetical protein